MLFFTVASAIILHTLFWGAGLALIATPRPWRRYWPVFVPVCGLMLQSTAVWIGANCGLPGTNSYAWASEALPAVLLVLGVWRRRGRIGADLARFGWLGLAMCVLLAIAVWPFAAASNRLTSSSMGSCDAADYAAGARVLREFSKDDRIGFMGLREVVELHSVDNFFDHWIRLNHFAPSALIAHHAGIFGLRGFEIINVFTAGLLALSLPLVFWLARSGARHGPGGAFLVSVFYGFSPLLLYAVYHVAIGQLLAAQAIALLTWIGFVAARAHRLPPRTCCGLGLLAFVGFCLVLGSYHFIVVVCLAPAAGYAALQAFARRDVGLLARWSALMTAPLLAAAGLYLGRVLGLVERMRLFREIDFGWKIPLLTPEGWLGIVASRTLGPHDLWFRLLLGTMFVALCIWTIWSNPGRQRPWRLASFCLVAPTLVGYAYLHWRAAVHGTNASYDAYKLFAVFYPGMLATFTMWLRLLRPGSVGFWRPVVYGAVVTILVGNLFANASMWQRMRTPSLIVNDPLIRLRGLEGESQVESINVLTGDVWSRLWANSMLLRKPQFFRYDTYEGRKATPLRGSFDLVGSVCRFEAPGLQSLGGGEWPFLLLQNTRAPGFLRVTIGDGWHDLESDYRTLAKARWTTGNATLVIDNPSREARRVVGRVRASTVDARPLEIALGDTILLRVATARGSQVWDIPEFVIQPGRNVVEFRSDRPGIIPPGKDRRKRGFRIEKFVIKPAPSRNHPSAGVTAKTATVQK
ncbi:MAG: hypothetical protein KF715_01805 [Candidatus Didemnitutus sp.]|nr:hypothetical protein [Candidatus Didemnitutus sp.]